MKVNINSVMIYLGLICFILLGINTGKWGSFFGSLIGILIIYFLLANEQEKKNIIKNINWRTK